MKKHIFTGLIILLPIALTLMVIFWLFNLLTNPFSGFVQEMIKGYETLFGIDVAKHETITFIVSRIIVLILLFVLIFVLGFIGNRFFFRTLLEILDKIFLKIPVVKSIFKVTKEITQGFFSTEKKIFSKTVLVDFPHKDAKALGLVSGTVPTALQRYLDQESVSVFVPTSPHPISGFLVLCPKSKTIDLDLTTEETFKFLISCGVVFPGEEPPKEKS